MFSDPSRVSFALRKQVRGSVFLPSAPQCDTLTTVAQDDDGFNSRISSIDLSLTSVGYEYFRVWLFFVKKTSMLWCTQSKLYINFLTISPLLSALPFQDVNIHKAMVLEEIIHLYQYIGGLSLQDEFSTTEILRILWGVYLFKKSIRCTNILAELKAERNILSSLCLFVITLPIS